MWRKILLGIILLLILVITGLYFSLPVIAESKLNQALENADSASFSQLEINFWEGNIILRDLYVLDTGGQFAGKPIKLQLERISIKRFNVLKMLRKKIAHADSFVIGKGSIEIPLHANKSANPSKKGSNIFLYQISVDNILLDSVTFDIGLSQTDSSQHARGTIVIDAEDVNIPLQNNSNFTWIGNFAMYDAKVNDSIGELAGLPFRLNLDRLEFKGLDANDLKNLGGIKADNIFIGKGNIYTVLGDRDTTKTTNKAPREKILTNILLNHFQVDSLDLKVILNPKDKRERIETSLSCQADNIIIPLHENAALSYENLILRIDSTFIWPQKSTSYYTIKNCTYNAEEQSLAVNSLEMRQSISETKYAQYFGWDKPYITLNVFKAIISGIPQNLKQLSDGINLTKITVLGLQAYLYKDKRLPHPTTPKPFPIEALSSLKFPVFIDEIEVIDGQLFYNENWREDYIPGQLSLNDMQVKINNVSSTGPTEKGEWTTVKGNMVFMTDLELAVDWQFDLRTKGKSFKLDLGIGDCPFESLNPFTENTVGARFKKGTLQGGRMLVTGNKTSGSGTLDLYYKEMKVEFLDKQSHHKNILEWAGGGLTNMVVRNNNLKDKKPKQGIVYAEPKADRAIYAFVIKLFFSGLKDIALGSSNEKKIEQQKVGK
jgi:hypothetical protein